MWCKIHKSNTSGNAITFDGKLISLPREYPFTKEFLDALRDLPAAPDVPDTEV